MKYLNLDIVTINNLLKEKKITPTDLVLESFDLIEKNKDLNAYITLNKEEALKEAKLLEEKEVDSLTFGLPIAIKDNILTKNLKTTAASKILENFNPIYDADVIKQIKDSNMIIIGKTNMDEFAMGSSNQTSFFGAVKNPWNKALVPGGSSGGSAAAIASRTAFFALGTDTGGSIRQPSSFCGLVGLKPTYGRISRYGIIAFGSSFDQAGPMTKNVYENAVLLNVLAKKSDKDLTTFETNEDFTRLINKDVNNLKVAIPNFFISDLIDKEIRDKFNNIIKLLEEKNVQVDYIDIDYLDKAVMLYQILALGEASSNLARYDGIRYGYSYDNPKNIDQLYKKTRGEGFGSEVKRRIMIGSYVLSGSKAITHYTKALEIRHAMRESFLEKFSNYDLIIGPTTTTFAYELGKDLDDAVKSFLDDILTIPVNLAGLPGLNLPIGFSKTNLPIGMQIIAGPKNEAVIYQLASFIEKELNLNLEIEVK